MSGFQPGDLIYCSKPYAYVLINDVRGKRCDFCFAKQDGLKRCSQCSFMYFCNRECQAKAWQNHKLECKYIRNAHPNLPSASMRLLANIIFKIKKYGLDEPSEIVYGHKINFRRLLSHSNEMKQDHNACQQMVAILGTLKQYIGENNIPPPSQFIEIFGKMCVNSFSICDGEMQTIGSGIYLGGSIFDHSCEPDAEVVFNGINICVRAVKKITHTDVTQICICYIEQLQLLHERQQYLKEHYFFCCQCPRCTSSYYEDLMTKTHIPKKAAAADLLKFKTELDEIKQMKKDKIRASKILEVCMEVLERQDRILAETHLYHINVLEIAFDVCIESSQWADAIIIGKRLIKPYKLLLGMYHPNMGIHYFKVGKIQNLQGLVDSAKINLFEAEKILKVTHGADHPLYLDLIKLIDECTASKDQPAIEE